MTDYIRQPKVSLSYVSRCSEDMWGALAYSYLLYDTRFKANRFDCYHVGSDLNEGWV